MRREDKMRKRFTDLYANKNLKVTITSDQARVLYENQIQDWNQYDYGEIKNLFAQKGLTTGLFIWGVSELCVDTPEGWMIADYHGKVIGSGGKYSKLERKFNDFYKFYDMYWKEYEMDWKECEEHVFNITELNEKQKELVKEIVRDKKKIISGQYDVIYAEDYVDVEMVNEHRMSYEYARELFSVMLEAEQKDSFNPYMILKRNEMFLIACSYMGECIRYFSALEESEEGAEENYRYMMERYDRFLDAFKKYFEAIRYHVPLLYLYEIEEALDEKKEMRDLACYMAYYRATGSPKIKKENHLASFSEYK